MVTPVDHMRSHPLPLRLLATAQMALSQRRSTRWSGALACASERKRRLSARVPFVSVLDIDVHGRRRTAFGNLTRMVDFPFRFE
jgi:hypothetical protein